MLVAATNLIAASRMAGARAIPTAHTFRNSPQVIRSQGVVSIGRCINTLHTALPASLLGIVDHSSVAAFSAVDRPLRMGLVVLAAIPSRMQSWIVSTSEGVDLKRARFAIASNFALGLIAAVAFSSLGPTVIRILFVGQIESSRLAISIASLLVLLICFSRGVGLTIVAYHRANSLTIAVSVAAAVGLVGSLTLGRTYGEVGVFTALVLAEAAGLLVQGLILRRIHAQQGTKDSATTSDAPLILR